TVTYVGARSASSRAAPGNVAMGEGSSTINTTATGPGSVVVTFGTYTRNVGGTVNFVAGGGAQTLGSATNQVIFNQATAASLTNGIIKGATVTDPAAGNFNLATAAAGGTTVVAALTTYATFNA